MIYIYTRISSYGQASKGEDDKVDSIENQIRRCKGWLIANNFDDSDENLTVIQEKAVSGAMPLSERAEGGPMLEALQEGDVVICYKLDRLFRSMHDSVNVSQDLRDRKITLVLMDLGGNVTDDMMGQMYFTMLSLFAQFERTKIATRTKEGSENRAAEGGFIGGPAPFGWVSVIDPKNTKRKTLVKNDHEQGIIELMMTMRDVEKLSYEIIARRISQNHFIDKHLVSWMRIHDRETLERNKKNG